ncbi:MAG: hypothetical protein ACOYY3_09585 [Chloroflexota bacterium]
MKNEIIALLVLTGCLIVLILVACAAPVQEPQPTSVPTAPSLITRTTPTIAPSPVTGIMTSIAQKDVEGYTNEDIVKLLLTKWLESYKGRTNEDAIEDYKVVRIILENDPSNHEYKIIATAIFDVKPNKYSQLWASLAGFSSGTDSAWEYCGATFGVYTDGDYFVLKLLPGWGT